MEKSREFRFDMTALRVEQLFQASVISSRTQSIVLFRERSLL